MANLLADASLWYSMFALNTPPEFWDGSEYFIAQDDGGTGSGGLSDGIALVDPAPAGSTVAGTLNALSLDNTFFPTWFFVVEINGTPNVTVIEAGNSYPFEYDLDAGDAVRVFVSRDVYTGSYQYSYEVEIIPAAEVLRPYYVYELERGWTFDGAYIPHFLELNWFFGDTPVAYHTIQNVRIHGLTKGNAYLQVSTNGIQTSYLKDYSSPQYIDLLSDYEFVSSEFTPVTEGQDLENRGIAIQMKFQGRNTDIALPEPAHVLQVLVVQSSPSGTGATVK